MAGPSGQSSATIVSGVVGRGGRPLWRGGVAWDDDSPFRVCSPGPEPVEYRLRWLYIFDLSLHIHYRLSSVALFVCAVSDVSFRCVDGDFFSGK